MVSKVVFSHSKDAWETPQDLFDRLNREFMFTLDPCATDNNHKCDKYYTIADDGLSQPWEGETVFINPPYSDVSKWVEKAYVESVVMGTTCVMLLAARTDTKWFHNFVYNVPNVEIRFIKGRLRFVGAETSAPFPSMIVIFRGIKRDTESGLPRS